MGTNAVLKIVLDGVNAGAGANGLEIQTMLCVIKGLDIQRFNIGIRLSAGSGDQNLIRGNYIGTNAAGTQARPNNYGVWIERPHSAIGGFDAQARNLISGNTTSGIYVAANVGPTIAGNYIGTNAAGTAALGNGVDGIRVAHGAGAAIGGTDGLSRNVISGNGNAGIMLDGANENGGNKVQGNYLGTKADGSGDLGNGYGIYISGSDNNIIGGTGTAANVISNSDGSGIFIEASANGNVIQGNQLNQNAFDGVHAQSGPNTISGNAIFLNGRDGVRVEIPAVGINITGNSTFANAALAIDLVGGTEDPYGTTANDVDDPDAGANHLQNFPRLTRARRDLGTGVTEVVVTLNSRASRQYRIELFVAVADLSGHGEGLSLIAAQTITTDAGGDKVFSFLLSSLSVGQVLTATATDVTDAETSEFSANRTVSVL